MPVKVLDLEFKEGNSDNGGCLLFAETCIGKFQIKMADNSGCDKESCRLIDDGCVTQDCYYGMLWDKYGFFHYPLWHCTEHDLNKTIESCNAFFKQEVNDIIEKHCEVLGFPVG